MWCGKVFLYRSTLQDAGPSLKRWRTKHVEAVESPTSQSKAEDHQVTLPDDMGFAIHGLLD